MKNPLQSIKDKVTQYIQLRFEIIRLEFIERTSNVMGYFAFIILSFFLFFLITFFVGFGLAEWFSALFESRTAGYFATAGCFLLITIVIAAFNKKIIRFFADKMVWMLSQTKKKKDSEEEEEEEEA